jgi:hypothetical protein
LQLPWQLEVLATISIRLVPRGPVLASFVRCWRNSAVENATLSSQLFFEIKTSEARTFSEFLLDEERTIPVVFVSRRNRDRKLLCDPSDLADKLVGIAYVCIADDIKLSWKLVEHIDNRLNTYDGTVRVYWPQRRRTTHPIVTAGGPRNAYLYWKNLIAPLQMNFFG